MGFAEELVAIERRRLGWLVEGNVEEAGAVHAADFVLVSPNGRAWTKEEYLGGIASGEMTYKRFEPVSEIDVMVDGEVAVLKYRSAIEIVVAGQEPLAIEAWHLDCYGRNGDGDWQVRWSQATAVS
jgi:hypothetical protein